MYKNIATAPFLLLAAAAAGAAGPLPSSPPPEWKCKSCPEEEAASTTSGFVEGGVAYQNQDSLRFGRFSGMTDKGATAVANGELRYRGTEGSYLNAQARDVGLDSRALGVKGGQEGSYKVSLDYDQQPFYRIEGTQTPYSGVGGDALGLPVGWIKSNTTTGMTGLPGALHPVSIGTDRKRLAGGFSYQVAEGWQVNGRLTRDTQEGTRIKSAFIGSDVSTARSVLLPSPVDYRTDQFNLALSYADRQLQGEVGYYGSFFRDNLNALNWQNPFTGVSGGQLALPPDNEFQQIFGSLGYNFSEQTRAVGYFAHGTMTQDDAFLPATVNTTIGAMPLPRTSLDGQVDVTSAKVRLTSRLLNDLGLNAEYQYYDRDNQTDQALYSYVLGDTSTTPITGSRSNLPYSYTRNTWKASANYRLTKESHLSGGLNYEVFDRTYQDREQTQENTGWTKLTLSPYDWVDVAVNLSTAKRTGDSYSPSILILPGENPLLRKYYLADRDRNKGGLSFTLKPVEKISVGFGVDFAKDDYSNSPLGLTSDRDTTYSADLAWAVQENLGFHFFFTRDNVKSEQAGMMVTSLWTGNEQDQVDTAGIGMNWTGMDSKLRSGLDYVYSRSRSAIALQGAAVTTALPDYTGRLHSLRLYGNYRMQQNLTLGLHYTYERFNSVDWALDNVVYNTIPQVLTLSQTSPDYNVSAVAMTLRYDF